MAQIKRQIPIFHVRGLVIRLPYGTLNLARFEQTFPFIVLPNMQGRIPR